MIDPRRGALLLGFGTIVLLLASGCAVPQPDDTPPAVATAPDAPTNDGDEPLSVLPIGCADIFALSDLQSSFVAPLSVHIDETSTPIGVELLEFKQAGGLECVWGGQGGTDGVPDAGLELWISPDAKAAYTDFTIPAQEDDILISDTIGDSSVLDCGGGQYPGLSCRAEVLVGDYWIDAFARDSDQQDYDAEVTAMTAILTKVADAVAGSGTPRPVWVPAADALDGTQLCNQTIIAEYALDVAAPTLLSEPRTNYSSYGPIADRAAGADCTWTSGERTIYISTATGGTWIYDRLKAEGIGAGGPTSSDAVVIDAPGVDGALVACGDGCNAVFLYKGSTIVIDNFDGPIEEVTKKAQTIGQALGAAF